MTALGPEPTAILEAAVARIVPADDNGPGAREAGVADYISRVLERDDPSLAPVYRDGLAELETRARATFGRSFPALEPGEQDAVLAALEGDAGRRADSFFELLLQHVREGMFGDPAYGGNRRGLGWQLIGYPGPRPEWSAAEQRIVDER